MRELWKTLIFVGVAVLLTGAAYLTIPERSGLNNTFNDQGQPFFPEFKDPLACTDLEVIDYDPSTATASRFKVMFKDGKWVIPSHYNYPADAKDRLAKTAGGVMDLRKDTIRSDRVDDQEELGVIDPLDAKAATLKGRGKRITLRDTSEKVLADFIIGKEIRDRSSRRYVRVPGQKRTYGVNVKVDLSTRFADWIETNLLKIDAGRVRRVVFNNTKVDLDQGGVQPGQILTIERKDSGSPWTMAGLGPNEELSTEKLSTLTSALSDLKISGVRPKPPGLTRDLKTGEKGITLTQAAVASLQSRGFFPTRDGRLLSNQGDVVVSTDEGAVYTLRYGEVVFASGEELSAGVEDTAAPAGKGQAKKAETKKAEGVSESRYLMVTAAFDPALLPPAPKNESQAPLTLPESPFQLAPDDPKRLAEEKAAQEKADKAKAEEERRVAEARKHVDELGDRFAPWYYVTPGESFRSIALDRAALVGPKKPKTDTTPSGSDFPGVPQPGSGFPGLPQP